MTSIYQTIAKPFHFIFEKCRANKKALHISPSELSSPKANVFHSILSHFEAHVVSFQSFLIWKRPFLSAIAFVLINIVYWLIVSVNGSFFSIISYFTMLIFGCKMATQFRNRALSEMENTERHDFPEVSRHLEALFENIVVLCKTMWTLRRENHGLFCGIMCGFLLMLAVVGKLIPGVLIIYTFAFSVYLVPCIALHLLPSTIHLIIGFFESGSLASYEPKVDRSSDKDSDLEEFVPETTPELLRQLTIREEVLKVPTPGIVLAESGTEDLPSIIEGEELSLCHGLGSFPSIEEDGESDVEEEVISESEIMPSLEPENNGIHFLPTHFKDSSESDSEVLFTEGLAFDQKLKEDVTKASASALHKTDVKYETSTKRKVSSSSEMDDDDLDDFEILEESDLLL